jgi:RNA 2',3'-cyclic 3'-phosphodiesterase
LKRLFFALWPDEFSRQRCAGILESLDVDGGKGVPLANLHVTLVFLGNLPESSLGGLRAGADLISVQDITIRFDRLSFWKRAGALCLTATDTCPELDQLAHDLRELAEKLAITIESRPYKPHVTLFRHAAKLTETAFEPVIWRSSSFCLAESVMEPGQASRYGIIQQWSR